MNGCFWLNPVVNGCRQLRPLLPKLRTWENLKRKLPKSRFGRLSKTVDWAIAGRDSTIRRRHRGWGEAGGAPLRHVSVDYPTWIIWHLPDYSNLTRPPYRSEHSRGRTAYSAALWSSRGSLFRSSDNHPVTSRKTAIAPSTMKSKMMFSTGMATLPDRDWRQVWIKCISPPTENIDMGQSIMVILGSPRA
ncbi:MAG: hypothetical protein ACI8S3_000398 [Alphaproteobacteria bacterium]|jgi:hypothetical protein